MNPIAAIEKFITEHGSAAVLEKHLALLKDQLAAATFSASEANERASLAEARAAKAEARVLELQQNLQDLAQERSLISESQSKILKVLHQNDSLSTEKIASLVGLSAPDAKGHLGILANAKYVTHDLNASTRDRSSLGHFYITGAGRAQAMKNG